MGGVGEENAKRHFERVWAMGLANKPYRSKFLVVQQSVRNPVDPSHCTWGVERRAEFSALGPLAAVSRPWVPAWGLLEPPRRDGENAKTGRNGQRMGEMLPNNYLLAV